jgi:ATP-binding cassette subfamily B protein
VDDQSRIDGEHALGLPAFPGLEEPHEATSIYDRIQVPPEKKSIRRLPRLVHAALSLVWRSGRRQLCIIAVAQVFAGAGVAVQLFTARSLLRVLTASGTHRSHLSAVIFDLVLLGLVFAVVSAAAELQTELSPLLTELVAKEATGDILSVADVVDLEAFETPAFHDRLGRARFNALNRPVLVVNGLLGTLGASMTAAGVMVALLTIQPLVAVLSLVAVLPLWLASTKNGRDTYDFSVLITPTDRERNNLSDNLTNKDRAKEIRSFASGPFLRRLYEERYAQRITGFRRLTGKRLRRALLSSVTASLIATLILVLIVNLILDGTMTLATAGTAIFAVLFLAQSLQVIVGSVGGLYEATLFIEDVNLFLKLQPAVEAARPRDPAPTDFDCVRLEDVTFTYVGSRQPALRNVSMTIERGQVIALVGENGSGKTTLAKLLAALYRPDSGKILWDDKDVSTCDAQALRRSIGVVFQDFGQYWLSARDNIGMASADRADDLTAIRAAAVDAGADDFITSLPDGYGTVLSRMAKGGRDLSIGQWQRIALARAFFRDAPLVIMDEPTAALDAKAEHELFESMGRLATHRAVLLISHRFSSVRSADRIDVMKAARIIESGNHAELMALGGWYAEMFTLQAGRYVNG